MPKLIAVLILAAAVCAGCDVSSDVATTSPTSAPRATTTTSTATSSPAPAATTVAPTAAPVTQAPAPPPPAPPAAKPAPTITPVPARGARGSNFVLQFSGFPTSAQGVDIVQTVTLPTGAKLAPKTFLAKPDGTGFTTYTPNLSDPVGQYVVTLQVAGGGVSAFAIITVF